MKKYTKLSDAGEALPADAEKWAAVQVGNLICVPLRRRDHAEAEKACGETLICGQPGRLPTIEELFLLADRECRTPATDLNFFPDMKNDCYWTSTPAALDPDNFVWVVDFKLGTALVMHRDNDCQVLAVRTEGANHAS